MSDINTLSPTLTISQHNENVFQSKYRQHCGLSTKKYDFARKLYNVAHMSGTLRAFNRKKRVFHRVLYAFERFW